MSITTVILIKESALITKEICNYYLKPLKQEGILPGSVLVLPLLYNTPTKIIAKTAKAYLVKLKNRIPTTVTNLITMGFSAMLFAPALIGFIAETYSLTINMYALCVIVFIAGNIFLRKFRAN